MINFDKTSQLECPLPKYYFCHMAIALLIGITLWPLVGLPGGLAAGITFYAGREIAQWQDGKPFDWPGIIAPLISNGILIVLTTLYMVDIL